MKSLHKTGKAVMAESLTLISLSCLQLLVFHKYIRLMNRQHSGWDRHVHGTHFAGAVLIKSGSVGKKYYCATVSSKGSGYSNTV